MPDPGPMTWGDYLFMAVIVICALYLVVVAIKGEW